MAFFFVFVVVICFVLFCFVFIYLFIYLFILFTDLFICLPSPVSATEETSLIFLECFLLYLC